MKKLGLTLLMGLSGLAVACTGGSRSSNKKRAARKGGDNAMGAAAGRWGGPGWHGGMGGPGGPGGPGWRGGMGGPGGPGWRGGMGGPGGPGWRGGMGGPGGPSWRGGMGGPGGGRHWRGGMGGPGGGRHWRGGMGGGRRWRGGMGGGRRWRGGMGGPGWRGGAGSLSGKSEPRNPAEKKVLDVLAKLDGQRAGMANVSLEDGRMLRLLVGLVGAKRVVEIGTSNGYSTLWLALGLLSTGGKVTTFERDADKAKLATKHFAEAGVTRLITVVQGDAHKKVAQVKGPIDLLFLDADKSGCRDYLEKLLPKVRAGGVIVAHNMVYPRPDPDFIKAITTDKALATVFVHLYGPGLAIALKKR